MLQMYVHLYYVQYPSLTHAQQVVKKDIFLEIAPKPRRSVAPVVELATGVVVVLVAATEEVENATNAAVVAISLGRELT